MSFNIIQGDCSQKLCEEELKGIAFFRSIDLTFFDPPFNQSKEYAEHNDNLPEEEYWDWMLKITRHIYELTSPGGAIYFMQREKNSEYVLRCLRLSGWCFQNLIIWKKKTSAVPGRTRFGKHYQIIAFATKGTKPRAFHRLRISPPLPSNYKHKREKGMYVTDVWDDIRELTSGYFAGDEPLRDADGNRLHKQQTPVRLLTRIILSSSNPGDLVFDPFAGTGTTIAVAEQLRRDSIGIELDPNNVRAIETRLSVLRDSDNISKVFSDYQHTPNLQQIWGSSDDDELTDKSDELTQIQLQFYKTG